jgi:thiol-disulfide isomerase/thioredoxin
MVYAEGVGKRIFGCVALVAAAFVWQLQGASVLALQVQRALAAGDMRAAQAVLQQYRSANGTSSVEYAEGLSWLGRGQLSARQFAEAEATAQQVRTICLATVGKHPVDSDPGMATALGASIEVQANAAAQQGRRDEAVVFLRDEQRRWKNTNIVERISKNLNLLTLEGKPAPALETSQGVLGSKPRPLAQHRGHPVLLFFWAHWCPDCKAEIAVIERLERTYGARGLEVIAATKHYGYVANGQDAPPDVETTYIAKIWTQYYAGLGKVETPLSTANFATWGVSTTPTLALVDKEGIVRLYNPGNLSYEALAAKIEPLL